MKLAIIGPRTCPQVDLMDYLEQLPDEVVSGGAKGADTYAREFAVKNNIPIKEFLPDYDMYPSKIAPLVRNRQIVEYCDSVFALWDGESRGTKYTIDYAKQMGKPVRIVNYITNEIISL